MLPRLPRVFDYYWWIMLLALKANARLHECAGWCFHSLYALTLLFPMRSSIALDPILRGQDTRGRFPSPCFIKETSFMTCLFIFLYNSIDKRYIRAFVQGRFEFCVCNLWPQCFDFWVLCFEFSLLWSVLRLLTCAFYLWKAAMKDKQKLRWITKQRSLFFRFVCASS